MKYNHSGDLPFEWGETQITAIMRTLDDRTPLVPLDQLRCVVERFPQYLKPVLATDDMRANNVRTAYRAFARTWNRLRSDLQERILEGYKEPVCGLRGMRDFLEWLFENLTEDYGHNAREKRRLLPLYNSLARFDDKMIADLSYAACRVRGYDTNDLLGGENPRYAIEALTEAAEVLGRDSISKAQQQACQNLHETWTSLPPERKHAAGAILSRSGSEKVDLNEAVSMLEKRHHSGKAGESMPDELVDSFADLEVDTVQQIVERAAFSYGSDIVIPNGNQHTGVMALHFLISAACFLADPRSARPPRYSTGRIPRAMVLYAAWLLVLSGHAELTATDTGPLANLLTEIDLNLEGWRECRWSWGDMIRDVLGPPDLRQQHVQTMRRIIKENPEGIAGFDPPHIVRIS